MNVFLLGFMGSGKSTIGRNLAEKLHLNFLDLDSEIEKEQGNPIGKIFEIKGEAEFRKLESAALHKTIITDNQIVSVGGGLPCFFDNMDLMNNSGLTVYLKMSAQALTERLWNLPEAARQSRPLLANKTKSELKNFIEGTLEKREAFYSKAKLIVLNDSADPEIATGRIKTALEYYFK